MTMTKHHLKSLITQLEQAKPMTSEIEAELADKRAELAKLEDEPAPEPQPEPKIVEAPVTVVEPAAHHDEDDAE